MRAREVGVEIDGAGQDQKAGGVHDLGPDRRKDTRHQSPRRGDRGDATVGEPEIGCDHARLGDDLTAGDERIHLKSPHQVRAASVARSVSTTARTRAGHSTSRSGSASRRSGRNQREGSRASRETDRRRGRATSRAARPRIPYRMMRSDDPCEVASREQPHRLQRPPDRPREGREGRPPGRQGFRPGDIGTPGHRPIAAVSGMTSRSVPSLSIGASACSECST